MNYTLYLSRCVEEAVRRATRLTGGRNTAKVDRALWIVSEIAKRSQLDWLVQGGYAITSYDHLNRGCPRNQIAGILKTLIDAGIIERDGHYLPAKFDPAGVGKSYGYRLRAQFQTAMLIRQRGKSRAVAETLARSFQRREEERLLYPLEYPYSELDRMAKSIRLVQEGHEPDVADDLMDMKTRWALVDEFGQRFHETHQALPRGFRHRLRIGTASDAPFVLDIAASQPLILTRLATAEARRRQRQGRGGRQTSRSSGRKGRGEDGREGRTRDHIEYPDFDGLLSDVGEIQHKCVAGDLYDSLIPDLQSLTRASENDPYRDLVDRDQAKTAFMIFCMSRAEVTFAEAR